MKKKIIVSVLVIVTIISIILIANLNKTIDVRGEITDFDACNTGYKFEESNLYVQLNKSTWVQVPGDYAQIIEKLENQEYPKNTYQISEYKIAFYYATEIKTDQKYKQPTKYSQDGKTVLEYEEQNVINYNSYLVYSDDLGKTWNLTQPSPVDENSLYMHFADKQIGYAANIIDAAGNVALVSLQKTINGGKVWDKISEIEMKKNSKIEFLTDKLGFYTMPTAGEENSELYMTSNGGETWSKVEILQSEIYDYYNIPVLDGENIKLVISQGSDGDYNGGDNKEYYSNDYGMTWNAK